jgi:PAS domain S-box-containing protein
MDENPIKVLLIEDDEDDFVLVRDLLEEIPAHSYQIDWVKGYSAGLHTICSHQHDVCLLDYHLDGRNGVELLEEAFSHGCSLPIILLTGLGDYQVDVEAMKAGAADYLLKNEISAPLLERTIRYAIERRRAGEELRKSEEKYRELVEKARSIIMRLDTQGRITFFNDYAEAFFGHTQGEILGRSAIGTIIPYVDSQERELEPVYRDLLRAPEQYSNIEMEAISKTGERAVIVWTNRAISDADGQVSGILSVGTDVTERKLSEKLLRLDEARVQALIDLSRMTNASVQELADFALEQAVQLTRSQVGFIGFVNEEESEFHSITWSAAVTEQCHVGHNHAHIAFEDAGIWVEAVRQRKAVVINDYGVQHPSSKGNPAGHINLSRLMLVPVFERDRITALIVVGNKDEDYNRSDERHVTLLMDGMWKLLQDRRGRDALAKSELQLRESNRLLQKVFDGISDPLVMVNRDLYVVMLNKAAMEYYGVERSQDILGKPCYQILRGQSAPCEECERYLATLDTPVKTFERRSFNRPERLEQVAIYPVCGEDGEVDSAIIRLGDITEKKVLERQLLQNEKLASLGLLVSGIAHEINNPNTFIAFNLPILRQYLDALMPVFDEYAGRNPGFELFHMSYAEFREDLFRLVNNMQHGSSRIDSIVSSLRSFVRKREKSELHPTNLEELIQQTIAICLPEIRKKVMSFEVIVPEDLPKIVTDAEALQQVILNLLINAAHACDKKDSRITVQAKFETSGDTDLVIEVNDNGIGMDERIRERIFDPFFTTKTSSLGTGLGLYVCYNLIEGLGGKIEVKSIPGEGSTFRVILPSSKEIDTH